VKIGIGIVEHGSSREPAYDLCGHFQVELLCNARLESRTAWRGFGANHNVLIDRLCDSDWYIALNPDVRASADAIRRFVEQAEACELTVAAPLFESPWGLSGEPQTSLPSPGAWLRETASTHARVDREDRVPMSEWVTGACMAINRHRAPGLRFDERYFMYFEDADLCLRVKRAGGRIGVVRDVTVRHESGWSSADPLRGRRGVEFARSALLFADTAGYSRLAMRSAGLSRFGSRILLGRTPQARTAGRAIARGFLTSSAPGLSELAREFNRRIE
jgi:GT2 family glycosyltransferase